MDKEWMRRRLPDKPPHGLVKWAENTFPEELGPQFLVFRGQRVPIDPDLAEIMEWGSLKPRRYEWAAECTCTACQETFITQKVKGYDAIRLAVGEDGMPYTLSPGEPYGEEALLSHICVEEAFAGEKMVCPLCFSEVEVIHSKKLRGGKSKRLMVQAVQNIEGYTAVIYWMVIRYLNDDGFDYVATEPMDAYVLTENGGLVRYSQVRRNTFGTYSHLGRWEWRNECRDSLNSLYGDWGSINGKKAGAVIYPEFPQMGGVTGEKTGILEFIDGGGFALVQYLKFWRTHRSIENLVKAGQAPLVAGIFRLADSYCYSVRAEMEKYVDLKKKKPHEMLRMEKGEFRQIRKKGIQLKADHLDTYKAYKNEGGKLSLPDFLDQAADFGRGGIRAAFTIMRETPVDLDKIARYMVKQNMRTDEVQYLVDTRRMARQANGNQPLTLEELWPRNLRATHDRLDQILAEQRRLRDAAEREKFNQQFLEVADRYGCLEWTDGELCVVLPKCSHDLHEEGRILRHCVGGYTKSHISGSDTIFFVRKYRRPERSYYTLDIRMNDGKPREVQLHGYGNERHGVNKEHSHKIPQKVRSFVDRWEKEILMPWWAEQNKQQKEKTA